MKIYRSLMEILIIVGLLWIACPGAAQTASTDPVAPAKVMAADAGYLENIAFEKLKGKERVVLMLSRQSGAAAEDQGEKAIAVKIENLFIPEDLRRAMGEGSLDNVIRVVPAQLTAGGKPQALIVMELNRQVPYSVRQDGHNVIIDFNVASLPPKPAQAGAGDKPATPKQAQVKATAPAQKPSTHAGRLVSLDFQGANIKSVLQLLAEESGVNIVSGDDVKGTVTISMKKVPWEQALDTVLAVNDLTRLQEGNIIRVITKVKLSDQQKRADDDAKRERTATEEKEKQDQLKKAESGKLKQVIIEAVIVEANTTFGRKLGVQWGGAYTGNVSTAKGTYPYTVGVGTNPSSANPVTIGQGIGLTGLGNVVNLPAAVAAPTIGIVMAGANAVISAQIAAMELSSEGKIISTPRVVIMEGEKAIIKQGEEIPVVTPATANNPATTTYRPAELKLEVTPKITEDGRISMTISATNNRPNRAEKDLATGNMPIFTNQVDSKVVIRDGDTIVIGGVMKSEESTIEQGVPWIYKVPVLGWLFKQESIERTKRELLIFVTPKIVKTAKAS
jgi:type IV pilus assembly protein PilQ